MERAVLFKFKSPSSILIVGPSGCGKTCFTESLLVHDISDLFAQPPTAIVYCYGAWQDKFDLMKHTGIKFHEGVPDVSHLQKWFTAKGGILVLNDLMAEGGNDKEVMDLFTKHSHHRTLRFFISVKICFHLVNTPRRFLVIRITLWLSRILATN